MTTGSFFRHTSCRTPVTCHDTRCPGFAPAIENRSSLTSSLTWSSGAGAPKGVFGEVGVVGAADGGADRQRGGAVAVAGRAAAGVTVVSSGRGLLTSQLKARVVAPVVMVARLPRPS